MSETRERTGEKRTRVPLRLRPALVRRLRLAAADLGVSQNAVLTQLAEDHLPTEDELAARIRTGGGSNDGQRG